MSLKYLKQHSGDDGPGPAAAEGRPAEGVPPPGGAHGPVQDRAQTRQVRRRGGKAGQVYGRL